MDSIRPGEKPEEIGQKLRELRKERGFSIRSLARASGLSANAISMIERGRSSPSINTLSKMAQALGISVSDFFQLRTEREDVVFVRASERLCEPFERGRWESLGGESFSGLIEAYILNLEVGATIESQGVAHPADELVFCHQGQVKFLVEGESFLLTSGDSLLLRSGLKHRWSNHGITEASLLIVLSGFKEADRPSVERIRSQA